VDGCYLIRTLGRKNPDIFRPIGWTSGSNGSKNILAMTCIFPKSAAAQLGISESFFRESVKSDSSARLIMGRGIIACNTPALQKWWDSKKHHRATGER
jgi:hypothetical protein